MRLLAPALAAALSTGCSFFAVHPPNRHPAAPLRCTLDRSAPGVDLVVAGLAVAGAAAVIIDDQSTPGEFQGLATVVIGIPLILLVGGPYTASAIYGYNGTAECRRLHGELRATARPDTPPGETPATAMPPAVDDDAEARRARARRLTRQAEAAARAGQCKIVAQLDASVKQLDADVHAREFARTDAIARCLAAAPPPPLPPPAPPPPAPPPTTPPPTTPPPTTPTAPP